MITVNGIIKYLFVLGAAVVPFTLLRFSFFGLGELFFVTIAFFTIYKFCIKDFLNNFPFTSFWIFFIGVSSIGILVNLIVLNNSTSTPQQISFDLASYLFILLFCFLYELNIFQERLNPKEILEKFMIISGFIYTGLFLLSFITNNIFGLPLKYHSNFAPLVENVHQSSMVLLTFPTIFLILAIENNGKKRALFSIFILTTFLMTLTLTSTKALLSVFLSISLIPIVFLFKKTNLLALSTYIYFIFICFLIFIYTFDIVGLVYEGFESADKTGSRNSIYSISLGLISESPIIGRGPGAHIERYYGLFWDSHQTYLTILIQGGIISFLAFMALIWKIFKKTRENFIYLLPFLPILIYSAGGDILRRLPVWVIVIFLFYFLDHVSKNKEPNIH